MLKRCTSSDLKFWYFYHLAFSCKDLVKKMAVYLYYLAIPLTDVSVDANVFITNDLLLYCCFTSTVNI